MRTISLLLALVGLSIAASVASCGPSGVQVPTAVRIGGQCMGTSWSAVVTLQPGERAERVGALVQDRLDEVDRALSTWKEESDLSRLNRAAPDAREGAAADTLEVLRLGRELWEATGGAFDPSVGPLTRLWGFGSYEVEQTAPTPEQVATALEQVGLDDLLMGQPGIAVPGAEEPEVTAGWIARSRDDLEVDASAVAKGYGVDVAAAALLQSGHDEFMIEVGGELVLSGRNPEGIPWRIGVDDPLPPAGSDPLSPMALAPRPPIARLSMTSGGVATSGDYRNVRRVGSRVVSHVIDPRTGYPIDHDLASATVIAPTCAEADGLATATMVLGPIEGLELLEALEGVEGYLLVRTHNAEAPIEAIMTSGMSAVLMDGPGDGRVPRQRGR
jgi:FAD:protein FMN transferase